MLLSFEYKTFSVRYASFEIFKVLHTWSPMKKSLSLLPMEGENHNINNILVTPSKAPCIIVNCITRNDVVMLESKNKAISFDSINLWTKLKTQHCAQHDKYIYVWVATYFDVTLLNSKSNNQYAIKVAMLSIYCT